MRAVNIGDLKNNLSRYLKEVRRGSEVVIKDRNKPIARIVPLAKTGDDETELMELIAEGAVRPPKTTRAFPKSFWTERLPGTNVDVSGLVREDRDAR
jgi:prevent-host-death family protein